MKQIVNSKLGALLITYSGIMSWLGAYGFLAMLLVVWKSYQDTILNTFPWFNLIWLIIFAGIPIGIVALLELFVFQPSRMSYANTQAYKHDNPVREDLELLLANQVKIMNKLGIENGKEKN